MMIRLFARRRLLRSGGGIEIWFMDLEMFTFYAHLFISGNARTEQGVVRIQNIEKRRSVWRDGDAGLDLARN